MRLMSGLRILAVAIVALGASVVGTSAQITTGNITGTVKDAQGGVVPGATVTLIDEAKGTRLAPATTDETGTYVFPNVTAATYTVEVTMERVQDRQRKGVPVSGGDRVSVPAITLEVGGTDGNRDRHGRVSADSGAERRAIVLGLDRAGREPADSTTATSRASYNWCLA